MKLFFILFCVLIFSASALAMSIGASPQEIVLDNLGKGTLLLFNPNEFAVHYFIDAESAEFSSRTGYLAGRSSKKIMVKVIPSKPEDNVIIRYGVEGNVFRPALMLKISNPWHKYYFKEGAKYACILIGMAAVTFLLIKKSFNLYGFST